MSQQNNRVGTDILLVKLTNLTAYIVKYLLSDVCHLETCLLCFTCQLLVKTWKCLSLKVGCLLSNIFTVNFTQLHIKILSPLFCNALKILEDVSSTYVFMPDPLNHLIHSFLLKSYSTQ